MHIKRGAASQAPRAISVQVIWVHSFFGAGIRFHWRLHLPARTWFEWLGDWTLTFGHGYLGDSAVYSYGSTSSETGQDKVTHVRPDTNPSSSEQLTLVA